MEEEIKGIKRKREGEKADGKKRLDDEEHIGALFYTYRPHSTEVAAAGNYERKRNDGSGREEKSRGSQSEPVVL